MRTTRSVALTDVGQMFLVHAQRVLADVAHARAEVDAIMGLVRGRLTIGAIQFVPLIDLPRLLAGFHAAHPGVDVALRTAGNELMLSDVRSGQLDLAFLSFWAGDAPSELGRLDVLTEPLLAVVPVGHVLTKRSAVRLLDLAREPFIELGHGSGLRSQSDQAFSAAGLERHVALEVAGIDDLLSLVALGLGAALLPSSLLDARSTARVHALPLEGMPVRRSVALVWREKEPVAPSARAFLADARRALSGVGAAIGATLPVPQRG